MKIINNRKKTTNEKVSIFKTTMPLLESMYEEFKELSKKKPDSPINKNKIKIANRLLEKIRIVLVDEDSIYFLDVLDEDDLPQASDVTLIFSQYLAAMKAFRKTYSDWNGLEQAWFTETQK